MIQLVFQVKCPRTVRVHRQCEHLTVARIQTRRAAVHKRGQYVARDVVDHRSTVGQQRRQAAGVVIQTDAQLLVRTHGKQRAQRTRCSAGLVFVDRAVFVVTRRQIARRNRHVVFFNRRRHRRGSSRTHRNIVLHGDCKATGASTHQPVAVSIRRRQHARQVDAVYTATTRRAQRRVLATTSHVIQLVFQVKCPRTVRVHRQCEHLTVARIQTRRAAVHKRGQYVARDVVDHRSTVGQQRRQAAGVVIQTDAQLLVRTHGKQRAQRTRCSAGLVFVDRAVFVVTRRQIARRNRHVVFFNRRRHRSC